VNVAIEIPDEVARQLAASSGEVSRAVLEAVAIEAYRSGAITPAQVQQMLGLHSRWETEALLRRAEAFHDYTMDDLSRDVNVIRDASRR
jgi:predicted HTH domain antitoxin